MRQREPSRNSKEDVSWCLFKVIRFLFYSFLLSLTVEFLILQYDFYTCPSAGKLIEINLNSSDKHLMNLQCVGHRNNLNEGATVILEAGLPYFSNSYTQVLQLFNQSISMKNENLVVCAYDRSGYGWSEQGDYPRTISKISDELTDLIHKSNLSSPFIVVGWSFGGYSAQLFAKRNIQNISGLILVDSCIGDQITRLPNFTSQLQEGIDSFNIARYLQPFGLWRLFGYLGFVPGDAGWPPSDTSQSIQDEIIVGINKPWFTDTAMHELLSFNESERILRQEVYNLSSNESFKFRSVFKDIPLVVMYAADSPPLWIELQKELLQLSHKSKWVSAHSNHYIPFHAPGAIVDAVLWVLKN